MSSSGLPSSLGRNQADMRQHNRLRFLTACADLRKNNELTASETTASKRKRIPALRLIKLSRHMTNDNRLSRNFENKTRESVPLTLAIPS
jgi:hypothetical protein